MTDQAFLRALAEAPRDDTHRLVYADWLEERGDPRAEWLLLRRTLASPVPDRSRYTDLCAREQELHRALDPVWLHAVRRVCSTVRQGPVNDEQVGVSHRRAYA